MEKRKIEFCVTEPINSSSVADRTVLELLGIIPLDGLLVFRILPRMTNQLTKMSRPSNTIDINDDIPFQEIDGAALSLLVTTKLTTDLVLCQSVFKIPRKLIF